MAGRQTRLTVGTMRFVEGTLHNFWCIPLLSPLSLSPFSLGWQYHTAARLLLLLLLLLLLFPLLLFFFPISLFLFFPPPIIAVCLHPSTTMLPPLLCQHKICNCLQGPKPLHVHSRCLHAKWRLRKGLSQHRKHHRVCAKMHEARVCRHLNAHNVDNGLPDGV